MRGTVTLCEWNAAINRGFVFLNKLCNKSFFRFGYFDKKMYRWDKLWQQITGEDFCSFLIMPEESIFFTCNLPNFGVKDFDVRLLVPSRKNSTGANPFWWKNKDAKLKTDSSGQRNNNIFTFILAVFSLSNVRSSPFKSLTLIHSHYSFAL